MNVWQLNIGHGQAVSPDAGGMVGRQGDVTVSMRQKAIKCVHLSQSGHICNLRDWDTVSETLGNHFQYETPKENGMKYKGVCHIGSNAWMSHSLRTKWTCVSKILKLQGGTPAGHNSPCFFSHIHLEVITPANSMAFIIHCFSLLMQS